MKYMILLFDDQTSEEFDEIDPVTFAEAMKVHDDFDTWCEDNNVIIEHSRALKQTPAAWTVRNNGEEFDGPYMELKEHLGGYYAIDAPTEELAREATRRCPNYGANELRPIATRE